MIIEKNKGFTIAELLIVTGIIAILVAIAIPILAEKLEMAREINDVSNLRAFYSEACAAILDGTLSETQRVATLPCGRRAYASFYDSGIYVKITGITFKQKDLTKWSIGAPNIAGFPLDIASVPENYFNYIGYHFGSYPDGTVKLSGIVMGVDYHFSG
ncbi:MAG: prepilin-type N-terminal cleavage/methylation domain-containing protein [Blautia sp.]|nr:prepilin-type N-terminal cleavage/methylation domain-containing protein [Blautia sp.]